jgi:hypothetical protein
MPLLSEEGQSVLDNLYRSCMSQLENDESRETLHFIIVLDPLYVSGLQQNKHTTEDGERKKRRLSKMERKRLGKEKNVSTITRLINESDNNNNKLRDPLMSSSSPKEANMKEATIVFQIKKCNENKLMNFLFSFLTKDDVCNSYVSSIV